MRRYCDRPECYERNAVFCWYPRSVKNLIDYLKGGHSLAEFLGEFPTIAREMAVQAIEEARIRCSAESMRILRVRVHANRLPIQFFRR
jgi:hypothetical protein